MAQKSIQDTGDNERDKVIHNASKHWAMLALLKNKYLVAGVFFLVWMLFFDPKDLSTELGRRHKYQELQASEKQMLMQIKATKEELGELKNNAQTIEKYAREKYLMKKDNEDLFIVHSTKE